MALTILNGLFLLEAKAAGTRFDSTLTLGRMNSFLAPRELRRLVAALASIDPSTAAAVGSKLPTTLSENAALH